VHIVVVIAVGFSVIVFERILHFEIDVIVVPSPPVK